MQEPQPRIAELLRTCIHPPSLLLRVAYVELVDAKRDDHGRITTSPKNDAQCFDGVHRFALKFVLTDGEHMIQALLHRKISGLRDAAAVTVGDLLDIRAFAVKKSPKLGGCGHTVYLAIEDCHFLLQPTSANQESRSDDQEPTMKETRKRRPEALELMTASNPALLDDDETAGGRMKPSPAKRLRLEKLESTKPPEKDDGVAPSPQHGDLTKERDICSDMSGPSIKRSSNNDELSSTFGARAILPDNEDEDDDFFEEAQVDLTATIRRRKALRKLDSNVLMRTQSSLSHAQSNGNMVAESTAISASRATSTQHSPSDAARCDGTHSLSQSPTPLPQQRRAPIAPPAKPDQPADPTQATQQTQMPAPPYHTLGSLRHPPPHHPLPSKNYAVTTLAFVSWTGTSLIHRSGSPFPPKRHLKIVDPSLAASRPASRHDQPPRVLEKSTFAAQTAFQEAVTVAVYIDAAKFKPTVGTLALLRGLTMQRLANGDIILNAYGRLKEHRFADGSKTNTSNSVNADPNETRSPDTHWFITNEVKIRELGYGSKFDYYREWWKAKHQMDPPVQTMHE